MFYLSTRGNNKKLTSSQAIIKGICEDGGLYVPSEFPNILDNLSELINLNYSQLSLFILDKFLVDFSKEELETCISNAYDSKFDTIDISPISKVGDNFFLELYHGPTLAFKDMALTIMPHLLKKSIEKSNLNKDVIILTATSGDTGKAALEGFKDLDGIKIIVFFPEDGVSDIQKLQMKTQEGKNTYVFGINGNFDDAQTGVKNIFNNKDFNDELKNHNYLLSSANSINIGRLLPQIIYYFHSYLSLVKKNEINLYDKINFVIPTGNFGNILAGFYAKTMGLPINKLICASNDNNILYDFFTTGVYDKNRNLKLTTSPSMDILISSNLERLLFELCNRDFNILNTLIHDLNTKGVYEISDSMKNNLSDFYAEYANSKEVEATIKKVFENHNYLIDTHTAVAYCAYEKYKKNTLDNSKTVIISTASPYKFSKDVLKSIDCDFDICDDFEIINYLSKLSHTQVPKAIEKLKFSKVIHKDIYEKENLIDAIKKVLF
ncbi:threonine synthase [Romboutsia sp.]|uniref:threonine synthase n=1 Tax=Romboutsia sp. TaxID=1965302 RepID=UPI002B77F7F8|nr:threonine synthase [Romboutsia sp.]HSQ87646.1 threonine synthase [Romboutsia sp.]